VILQEGLFVRGYLEIADPGMGKEIFVSAPFVFVTGHLSIGPASPASLQGKVRFRVQKGLPVQNPNLPQPVNLSYVREGCGNPGDTQAACAIELGHSAFAVVGGKLTLRGFPGEGPSWSRLAAHGSPQDTSLLVDGDLSGWPIGGELIVLSTEDMDRDETERRTITQVSYDSNKNKTTLTLDKALDYYHWGEVMTFPNYGPAPQVRAEVALLSRQIVIEGPPDDELDDITIRTGGGHFGVFFTKTPQHIEGVEFRRMGQQGTFGRYPFHMHLCRNHQLQTKVLKNAVVDSKQRCYVLHGTQQLWVEGNIAFNTIGHCFMLEDGYETGMHLLNNLVSKIMAPRDQPGVDPDEPGYDKLFAEDDFTPSGFWLSNPLTNLIGNVVQGVPTCNNCDDRIHRCEMCNGTWKEPHSHGGLGAATGVWFTMGAQVRRESKFLPDANQVVMTNLAPGSPALYRDNVMHGNMKGFKYYRPGWRPETLVNEEGNIFYQCRTGIFNHKNQNFHFKKYLFLDNQQHYTLDQCDNMALVDSAFVGVSRMQSETPGSYINTWDVLGYPRAVQWDTHFYFNISAGLPNVFRNITFINFDKTTKDQHGNTVMPKTINPRAESNNAQEWVSYETFDGFHLVNTSQALHFNPMEETTWKSYTPMCDSSYENLFQGESNTGCKYKRSDIVRGWTWLVKDSPDIDVDSAGGTYRWWVPANHWQITTLVTLPTFQGCYKNKGSFKINNLVNPWAPGASPEDRPKQLEQCAAACAGYAHFSLRRSDPNDPQSEQCLCMDASDMQKLAKAELGTEKCDCALQNFGGKTDWYNCVYDPLPSGATSLCKVNLPAAQNMVSCPMSICPRSFRVVWMLKNQESFLYPTALKVEALNSGVSVIHRGATFTSAQIMYGHPTKGMGKNANLGVGTGVMSLMGGEKYRFTVMKPDSAKSDWEPAEVLDLKMEFFDARGSLPTVLDKPECKIDVEIGVPAGSPPSNPQVLTGIDKGHYIIDFP
jgi:hypothetical protein